MSVCVCVCGCVCLWMCVCVCVCLSLGGKEKAEFYTFVSVRMSQYISEFVRISQYIFESVSMNHTLSLDMPNFAREKKPYVFNPPEVQTNFFAKHFVY